MPNTEEHNREAFEKIDLSALPDIRVMEAFVKAHEEVKHKMRESETNELTNSKKV